MDSTGDSGRPAGSLHDYLQDVIFPATKDELVTALRLADVPDGLVDRVRRAAADRFASAEEVMERVQAS